MYKIFLAFLLVSSIFVGCSKDENVGVEANNQIVDESRVSEAEYKKITAEEAKEMIDNNNYETILDVRTLDEYNEGHIENSTLLSVDEISEKAEELLTDKNQVILVYCRSGSRSERASRELINLGYKNVYDFGGILDWPYEVVK